jgi:two-component system, chemotaxis family, CheB/CheR fusion protein
MVSPAASREATRSALKRKLRVLVADDNRDEVLTLSALVEGEGHEVRSVLNGRDVLEALRAFQPDVVLLDIGMPDRNGYDLAREIISRYGDERPRLIAVTGWKKPSDRILAKLAGFDHHVAKPYDPQALLELLAPPKPT